MSEETQSSSTGPAKVRGNFEFIDLALPRIIVIRQGERTYRFTVKPISEALWFKYFEGIVSTSEREGKKVTQHVDTQSAGLELADAVIVESESKTLAHRLAVANVLTAAYAVDEDVPEAHDAGREVVRIHAVWSAGENGQMRRYKNLVHWLESPTAEQYRRYRRDDSRAQIVSGSRKGTTIYHGAQRTLAALYDELVVNVAGYAVNGVAIMGRDEIVRAMDAYHKVAAVAQLFSAASVEIEDEIEEPE
jgi:hypothetical protein